MSLQLHTFLQLGLLYGVATLSVVVSFRFLRFPDLTVDGSFVLGAAISGVLLRQGVNPALAILGALSAGLFAGAATAFWHRYLGVNKFFSGILTMMMLYSLNLRILGGANISLLGAETLFASARDNWSQSSVAAASFLAASIAVGSVFCSGLGLRMRGVGSNPSALPFSENRVSFLCVLGIALANSLAALSGALVAQYQQFVDVGMGLGVTVNVFAALFLGEGLLLIGLGTVGRLFGRDPAHPLAAGAGAVAGEILAASIGTVALMGVLTATLYLGLQPSDTKLFGALLLLVGLIWRRRRRTSFLIPPGEMER